MTKSILEELLSIEQNIGLCWLGNLSWLLRSGSKLIAFDLDLETDMRLENSPVPTSEIAPYLDYHFITHEHDDHFSASTSKILAEHSDCIFILPSNCTHKASEIGIPEERIRVATPGISFQLQDIKVNPVRAIHGHKHFSILKTANTEDCGYRLLVGGKTLFQPGDTVLLEDHLDLEDVDALFVSPTVHNMYIDRSTILIRKLQPGYIFPQHYGTYRETTANQFWTKGYTNELKAALPEELQERFHKLDQGEVFVIQ